MNYPCIFCLDLAIINPETPPKRATCGPCLDFILSTPEPTLQAFRMGALLAAREARAHTSIGQKARDIAAQAEQERLRTGVLVGLGE